MARNAALMAAGSTVVASSTLAIVIIWLLLARPTEVAQVASGGELHELVELAARAFYEMMLRILAFL